MRRRILVLARFPVSAAIAIACGGESVRGSSPTNDAGVISDARGDSGSAGSGGVVLKVDAASGSAGSGGTNGGAGSAGAYVDASEDYAGCTYQCNGAALDASAMPMTTLECFCANGGCPATYAEALDRLRAQCSSGGTYCSTIYSCSNRAVTVVDISGCLGGAAYYFDTSGALVGAAAGTDCNCGPCRTFAWGAGQVGDCERVQECAACPNDSGFPALPACSNDAGL